MGKEYFVVSEGCGVLNPDERPFRSLAKACALLARAREACSWQCMTDGEEKTPGRGNFRCGALSPHGISIQVSVGGRWVTPDVDDDLEPEPEKTRPAKGRPADWHLNVIVDRGTGYLADGDTDVYYTGPELTEEGWDQIAVEVADGDELVEWTVKPVLQGRYTDRLGECSIYPMSRSIYH